MKPLIIAGVAVVAGLLIWALMMPTKPLPGAGTAAPAATEALRGR
jgi:hypothetical protein